ncbi:MAG: YciI family protein [Candidatus Rokuibacteriota bacterium]
MPTLFAVTRSRGPAWNAGRPLEEQDEWPAHAAFMNALHRDGFVLLGGPLDGTPDVLLIAAANDADEITARLGDDSWTRNGLLRIRQIAPWTLRLGTL